MARNKHTPLKDEQEYNIDDLYQKLDEVLKAVKDRNLAEAKKLWNLGDKELVLYALGLVDFNKAVATAMHAYLKKHQDKIVVEGKQGIPEDAVSLLDGYRKALTEAKEQQTAPSVTVIDKNIVEAAVTTVIERGDTCATFLTKPEQPKSVKALFGYLLYRLPCYYIRRFFADRYVKWWFRTIFICLWLTSIFLTCFIAYDNAQLRETKEKYILLREFCRPDKDMSTKADYIEFLYSDKEEYKKDIDVLWERRRKRLNK